MAVFVVIGSVKSDALKAAIIQQYGANHYEFASNAWFVPDVGTTKDVMDKLGLQNGGIGAQGVVLRFTAYAGYANAAGWTWLQKNSDAVPLGG
jgi:hypothetical protein